MIVNLLLISISLSIDAFAIGVSYKLKGVRITALAKSIIGIVSGLIMWLSVSAGNLLIEIFPSKLASLIGISILAILGITFIRKGLFSKERAIYDFDKSKDIDIWEAVVLGAALSADSISTGIAAATLGIGYWLIPIMVGFMQIIFLCLGTLLLSRCQFVKKMNQNICSIVSGFLLLVMAFIRILK